MYYIQTFFLNRLPRSFGAIGEANKGGLKLWGFFRGMTSVGGGSEVEVHLHVCVWQLNLTLWPGPGSTESEKEIQ